MDIPRGYIELHASDDDDLFHTDEETSSLNSEVAGVQDDQQQTSEQNPILSDILNRLSSVRNYVLAGAEEEESSSSQETASEPEATVEEGLADFLVIPPIELLILFYNNQWRLRRSGLILHLLRYLINHLYHSLIKLQGLREDKDISKEEEKGGDKIEETETSIVIIAIIFIKLIFQYNSRCLKSRETEIKINLRNINLIQKRW